jgi:hypothetical protein
MSQTCRSVRVLNDPMPWVASGLPGGNSRPRMTASARAMAAGAAVARQDAACPRWSMEAPAKSGPTKLVVAPMRLKLLKLRARSSGLLKRPIVFCNVT